MPTTLRPNWIPVDHDSTTPPPDLQFFDVVAQPVPASDQSATIIRATGVLEVAADTSGGTLVFSLWDACVDGDNIVAGIRQIGAEITISLPDVAALGNPVNQQFILMWADVYQPQSGAYMIAYDNADAGGTNLTTGLVTIRSVAP